MYYTYLLQVKYHKIQYNYYNITLYKFVIGYGDFNCILD
ncbi:hypothetical protein OKW21_002860 [Catalinimonas alkaloidigena]|nr:hypothetical protein [Catalinimonas alkaloidigena]